MGRLHQEWQDLLKDISTCIYECDLANDCASVLHVRRLIKKSFDKNDRVKLLDLIPLHEDEVNTGISWITKLLLKKGQKERIKLQSLKCK